jgi:hypothetical protein
MSGQLPQDQRRLPAPRSGAEWPSQFVITKTARMLDGLVAAESRIERAVKLLDRPTARVVELAKEAAIDCERRALPLVVSKDDERSEADELLGRCEPDNWRDENYRPLKSEIAKMLAIHMGSIPMPSNIDVAVFTRVLLDDVMALEPRFYELEAACRELRTTKDWHPSIAEVITAIKKQQSEWHKRDSAVVFLEQNYEDLVEAIAKAEAQLAAEEERRIKEAAERRRAEERKAAKSQPLAVGDRVRTVDHGTGTVLEIVPIHRFYVEYLVRFDTTSLWHLSAAYFERLIAGDEGYEPPALPMIEHKPSLPMEPITLTDRETC